MSRHDLDATGIVDDACLAVSRVAAPWLGVYWLTQLPFRFLQVHFVDQILSLGERAGRFGDHLGQISLLTFLAFLPAVYGRLVWVRAVALGLASPERSTARPLAVRPAEGATYLYTALLLEVLASALVFTVLVPILTVYLGAIAPATARQADRPRLVRPILDRLRPAARVGPRFRLSLFFLVGWFLATVNLGFAWEAGQWLATAAGIDLAEWSVVLSAGNRLFVLTFLAGALLLVEPFWLAAGSIFVHRFRAQETGDDLRLWFEEIRAEGSR